MKYILITIISIVSLISCGGAEERKEVYLEKARQSLNTGDLDKARIELKNVLQIDPNDAQAYFQLGEVFEQQKEFRKAFGNYSKALELAPDNLEYNAKIGTYNLLLAGNIDAAIEKRDFILGKDASSINGLLLSAGILLKQDDAAGAKKITQDIFARQPGHIQNALLLSSLYLKDKKYDETISLLNVCIKENPESRVLLNTLAETYYKAGKYDLAESIYKEILEENPEAFMNYLKLAVFYKFTNKTGKAEQTLREAIDADEEDTKRKLALVEYLQQTKSNQAAIDELKSLTKKYPQEGDVRIALATIYMAENNLEDAKKVLKSAISDFPEDSTGIKAAVHLANIYIQEKNIDSAEVIINDALKISPNDAKLNFVKAKAQLINKDYEGAIISLRIVVKDDPENMEGYFLLFAAHSANGEKQQADEIINRAYENNKANAEGLMALANYYARNNNKDKLEKIVDHYLSINADDYQALSYKSALLNERKMVSEAKPYATKMIELYPDRPNGYIQSVPSLLTENRRDDAVNLLEDGYRKAEENGRIIELLVSLYVADENYDLAEKKIQAAIREKKESAELYMLLAKVQWKLEKKEAVEKNLLKSSSIKPDWDKPYISLADLYKNNNSNQKEIEILQQGLMQIKGDYKLSLRLARIYEELGDFNAAINVYDKAYEKYTDNVILMNNLAALLSEHRNDEASMKRAKDLADNLKKVDSAVILDTVGWVYYKAGDYSEAVNVLKLVVEKSPDVPIFNYHLGMAFYKTGDEAAAKTHLTSALANNNDFSGKDDANTLLKKIQ